MRGWITWDYLDGSKSEVKEINLWDGSTYAGIQHRLLDAKERRKGLIGVTITLSAPFNYISHLTK